jgi:hypothetical protein
MKKKLKSKCERKDFNKIKNELIFWDGWNNLILPEIIPNQVKI